MNILNTIESSSFFPSGSPPPVPFQGVLRFSSGTSSLSSTTNTITSMGNGPFTIEFWVKPKAMAGGVAQCFIGMGNANSGCNVTVSNSTLGAADAAVTFSSEGSGAQSFNISTTTLINVLGWFHVVIQRINTTGNMRIYFNGILQPLNKTGTAANFTGNVNTNAWTVGRAYVNSTTSSVVKDLTEITGVRISSVARYSGTSTTVANFPLPVNQFVPDANTRAIMNVSSAGTFRNVLTTTTTSAYDMSTSGTVTYQTGFTPPT